MRLSNIFLLSSLASVGLASIIPAAEHDEVVARAVQKTTTTTSSTSAKKTTTTSSTSTKVTTSSSSSTKVTTSSSKTSSKSTSTSSSTKSSSSSSTSTKVADSACTNSALTRSCWSNGFSIATDFDVKFPTTGKTVYYNFEVTNTTLAPDGNSRLVMAINGQYPGPTIIANWGDMISVTLKNSLQNNGTGLHFHGIRQYLTNTEDGVPGITECPLAPGDTKTYLFQATQYGTSWYHSHFSGQYGEGVLGGIQINGPATANYDIDLGTYTVSDWYYRTTFEVDYGIAHVPGPIPPADTGTINGSMISTQGGKYTTNTIVSGKKYRLRLINTSVDNHFVVSLDNHPFQVISADFVPIKPYTASTLFIGIGQRYDVIITANQTVSSYWFRAIVQDAAAAGACGANTNNGNILSIFTYSGAASTTPASTATPYTQRCTDETSLVPYWDGFVPSGPLTTTELDVAINIGVDANGPVITWGINLTALSVNWDVPVLDYVATGNTSYPASENLITLPTAGEWYYWIIQEVAGSTITVNVPHPIHLHGHDFFILGTGTGQYSSSLASGLNYDNPTRRDVAMLPVGGWLAIAFQTDNPGAWIMHCHIAWHAGEGLAVQFLESADKIPTVNPVSDSWKQTCANWNAYYPSKAYYLKGDSGI